jgi:hypothetical protein
MPRSAEGISGGKSASSVGGWTSLAGVGSGGDWVGSTAVGSGGGAVGLAVGSGAAPQAASSPIAARMVTATNTTRRTLALIVYLPFLSGPVDGKKLLSLRTNFCQQVHWEPTGSSTRRTGRTTLAACRSAVRIGIVGTLHRAKSRPAVSQTHCPGSALDSRWY